MAKQDDQIMNVTELAKYLGMGSGGIYRLVWLRKIPTIRVAGCRLIRFRKGEIDKWLESCTVAERSQEF
ncbi:helix-turn-helix domain-containing protein [Candidatus Kuenenia sp.]|uniref:helix-turn-helix transcriptional regulator n=1 Tax=Candidatus Kuenenia sp. TaxID=2499824 RepID=UPI0032205FB2